MSTFWAAIAGALAAGAATIAGSFWINRYELTRRHRVELVTDLLPSLINELEKADQSNYGVVIDLAQRVAMHAVVASRRDRKFGDQMGAERMGAFIANGAITTPGPSASSVTRAIVEEGNVRALSEREDHLEAIYEIAGKYLGWLRERF